MKLLTPRRSPAGLFLLICLVLLAGALAVAEQPPPAETPQPEQKPAERPATVTGGSVVDTKTFKVGPEDVLKVLVWGDTSFTGNYTIHTDGAITLPLIGDIAVGGLTPVAIEPLITTALSKYIVKPLVTVTVQAVFSRRYYIDGEVARSGEFSLQAPTTILDALSKAGGFRDFANLKKIYVLRGDKRIPFNYKEVIHGKNLSQNITLEPGDHIVVP
jgi:polysaccharide export outer membrane protein